MAYMETYQKWLGSPALSPEEKAELQAIANDPKEIESRFFGPLEFGTAGLRGTMAVGLNRMKMCIRDSFWRHSILMGYHLTE